MWKNLRLISGQNSRAMLAPVLVAIPIPPYIRMLRALRSDSGSQRVAMAQEPNTPEIRPKASVREVLFSLGTRKVETMASLVRSQLPVRLE